MPLTIEKSKLRAYTKIPVLGKPNLKKMVDTLLHYPDQIPNVLKTKKWIEARLEGKTIHQANIQAGMGPQTLQTKILSNPMTQVLLDELIRDKVTDPQTAERFREMWDAKRRWKEFDPETQEYVEKEGPDRDMQKYTMDKRLALGGLVGGVLPENQQQSVVTTINFTTVNVDASKTE